MTLNTSVRASQQELDSLRATLEALLGSGVEIMGSSSEITANGQGVVVELPFMPLSGSQQIEGDLSFTLGGLTLLTTDGQGTCTIELEEGLHLEGAATLLVTDTGIDVVISKPQLVFKPPAPDLAALTGGSRSVVDAGVEFYVDLVGLVDGATISVEFAKAAYSSAGSSAFELAGQKLATEDQSEDDVAFLADVFTSGIGNADLGAVKVTMWVSSAWFGDRRGEGKEITISKVGAGGTVHSRVASCAQTGGVVTCTAYFSGSAAGFSVFALHAKTAAPELTPRPTPTPFPLLVIVPENQITAIDPSGGIADVAHPVERLLLELPEHGIRLEIPAPALRETFQVRLRVVDPEDLSVQPGGKVLRAVRIELFDPEGNRLPDAELWFNARLWVTLSEDEVEAIGGLDGFVNGYASRGLGLQKSSRSGRYWADISTALDIGSRTFSARLSRFSTVALVHSQAVAAPAAQVTVPQAAQAPAPVPSLGALPAAAPPATGDVPIFGPLALAAGFLTSLLLIGSGFVLFVRSKERQKAGGSS